MAESFEIERSTGRCTLTGRELAEGETFYAVLFAEGETFRRSDYSLEAWSGPPADSFCYFKSRVPPKVKKRKLLVDDDVLVNFFLRLVDEQETGRVQLRFVLALILMRKRLLRYEDTLRGEIDREVWQMRLVKDVSLHQVVNPRLTDEQIGDVSKHLSVILSGDPEAIDESAPQLEPAGGAQV